MTRPWTVYSGDCRAVLRDMDPESIDACVTDTPYGLSTLLDPPNLDREALWRKLMAHNRNRRPLRSYVGDALDEFVGREGRHPGRDEFLDIVEAAERKRILEGPAIERLMKSWLDTGENPKVKGRGFMGKEWDALVPPPNTWREVWRVLKPGAYCLAFGGTRTYALIEMSLRFADFEVEDTVSWLYGCLSEDTEIMVDGEWRHWTSAVAGSTVMAYSLEDDTLRPEVVQDLVVYDYDDVAFHVRGDRTDHIVSRNHRCLVADDSGRWGFTLAEVLQGSCTVPILEIDGDLRGLWQDIRAVQVPPEAGQDDVLLTGVQRGLARRGLCQARSQGPLGVDGQVAGILPREDDWRAESSMAGRSDAAGPEGQLRGSSLRARAGRIQGDGEVGRLHHGASTRDGAEARSDADADRGRSSHQPRLTGQPHRESDAVRHEPGSQALRGARLARADLATVTPMRYRGKVWCVRVPSGAFVARRNGKIFITGNSGFPKRVRLDLKIDQHFGKAGERPVTGSKLGQPGYHLHPHVGGATYGDGVGRTTAEQRLRASQEFGAATPEAARFVGWDRALRPGWEPIIVACKPLRGTVAENALAHGTGGLHIDACRLPRGEALVRPSIARDDNVVLGHGFGAGVQIEPSGGYPANVAMDEEVAALLDEQSGIIVARDGSSKGKGGGYGEGWGETIMNGQSRRDVGGASRFFYTAKASSSERDAGLEGLPPLTSGERCDREDGSAGINAYAGTNGEGGRNPHPTVKPVSLMRWLCRLASPPGAHDPDLSKRPVILDPFFGSGSTGVAALQEGVLVVGVELDEKMADVARRRLQHAYALPRDDEQVPAETGVAAQRSLF